MYKTIIAVVCSLTIAPVVARAQDSTSAPTYLEFQVEHQARLRFGQPPVYPSQLRDARVNGQVLVQYVIDEKGAPQMESFKVLKSSDAEFSESVRRAVTKMSFYPAEIAGKKVKQLVQQPFLFVASK